MRSNNTLSFVEQARRQQIVQATVELLAEGGYGAASLATIASRIGASKGVISYHFAGKDDLLRHVVSTVLADAGSFMSERIAAEDSPLAKLRTYVSANMAYLARHRQQIRALSAILTGLPPGEDGAPAYAAAGREAVAALTALLEAGQRSGELRSFDARVAARSLRASIDAVSDALRDEPALDIDGYAADLWTLFERAMIA